MMGGSIGIQVRMILVRLMYTWHWRLPNVMNCVKNNQIVVYEQAGNIATI